MDHKFTKELAAYLEQPIEQRDYAKGTIYLLQLSGNKIMYRNLIARETKQTREFVSYQLKKYYDFRLQNLTHEEVEQMSQEVERIAEKLPEEERKAEQRTGKRDDHEQLPDEIKKLYEDNLPILQRMRELHLKLRTLSLENVTCPDSERYPFLKEIIKLDKQMHSNWERYDHYMISSEAAAEAPKGKASPKKKGSKK